MRLGAIPGNLIERLFLAVGRVPTPFLETHVAALLARAVMTATKLGVFEALAGGPRPAAEVAAACDTEPRATEKLLHALVGARYLRRRGRDFALAPRARKWLLRRSPRSLHDKMLLLFTEWSWIGRCEEFVRTGRSVRMHQEMGRGTWADYQRGMRALAAIWAPEVARRTPVPRGATRLLDVGGSHGLYSVALCRRHPGLSAVVLELPEAIEAAAPILAREGMGGRVVHRAGDVLTADLGEEAWDLVLIAQLVHHFDEATNRELVRRIARALAPGGVLVLQETVRPRTAKEAGQAPALFDLYFALTSEAGTWTLEEMAAWQRQAGLRPLRPLRFRSAPGTAQQAARKPPGWREPA